MRQKLISWLIEDIAPAIRQSKDAEGAILKFASDQNLAPSLVQALGQLYNTAKTLAYFEKAGAKNRGESFPILDVDGLVAKYLQPAKSASFANGKIDTWEFDNVDGAPGLPVCFVDLVTPAFKEEKVISTVPAMPKVAASNEESIKLAMEFQEQFRAEVKMDIAKAAGCLAQKLRERPEYSFEQMEADALGLFVDEPGIKDTLTKIADYCSNCFPRVAVKRASAPTPPDWVLDSWATSVMENVEAINDGFYKIQACEDFAKEAGSAAAAVLQHEPQTIFHEPTTRPRFFGPPPSLDAPSGKDELRPIGEVEQKLTDKRTGRPEVGQARDFFSDVSTGLDKWLLDPGAKEVVPLLKGMFKTRNQDQEKVDSGMQDARHMAILQQLLTTDEILAEADPDRVVDIFNTIRNSAPELAGDANVMRVLLRSAIAHDGIAPYDLKGILETELAKQKVDWNRRINRDVDYAGAKAQVPNKPM